MPVGDNAHMDARPVGEHALLVECSGPDEVAAVYAALVTRRDELGAVDLVPAARTVLLDGLVDPASVRARIASWASVPVGRIAGPEVVVPVVYDGEDLAEVARQWDVTTAEVVDLHTSTTFTVAFCGFAPGFAYCTGLPEDRPVARRSDPRTSVPAGSVALAGGFTAVYPTASPGGWQLIGRTSLAVWDPAAEPPALLAPGTTVRFVHE